MIGLWGFIEDKVLDTVTKFHDKNGAMVSGGTIATIPSTSLSVSGSIVTVPSGYYASQYTVTISAGAAVTPTTTETFENQPTFALDASGSKITATFVGQKYVKPTVTGGYIASGAGVSGQIMFSGTNEVLPSTLDNKFQASNIKAGVSIFAVSGTFTNDATITVSGTTSPDVLTGKTAYANGAKITGSMANRGAPSLTITNYTQPITLSGGFYTGGTVGVDQTNFLAGNIRQSVTILGLEGTYNPMASLTTSAPTVNSFFASGSETYREFLPAQFSVTYFDGFRVTPITVTESATGSGTTGFTITVADGTVPS